LCLSLKIFYLFECKKITSMSLTSPYSLFLCKCNVYIYIRSIFIDCKCSTTFLLFGLLSKMSVVVKKLAVFIPHLLTLLLMSEVLLSNKHFK
jgi:hypothetical protein